MALTGTVVSDKMNKTIIVRIGRLTTHVTFGKKIRQFNKIKAHDEKNSAKIGDLVEIKQVRPISKDKRWNMVEVLKKAENR